MSLVGRDIVIGVGEPWDFESQDGENVINAKIVEIVTREEQPCIVAEAQYEVDVPDVKARGRRFIILPRYDDNILDIAKGKEIIAAVAIVPPGKSDDAAIYAIIGSVSLK